MPGLLERWTMGTKSRSERLRALPTGQRGQTLIEVLVALAVLGIVATAFISSMTTASTAMIIADEQTTAESLSRSQLEYIRSQAYVTAVDGEATYQKRSGVPTYSVKGLGKEGYATYPDIDYSYVSDDIVGVPWDPQDFETLDTDDGIQIVTIIVYHDGDSAPVLATSAYKRRLSQN